MAAGAAAPSRFGGFPWPVKVAAPLLLGIPALLYFLGLANPQLCGVFYAVAFLAVCAGFAAWPAVEASESKGAGIALALVAVAIAAVAGYPLVRNLSPGTPAAQVTLPRKGEPQPLAGVEAGRYQLVAHASFGDVGKNDVNAGYTIKVASGAQSSDLEGRFQSQHARGRVGRQSVDVVKAPREWNRHSVVLASADSKLSLARGDSSLGEGLEVQLYPEFPLWMVGAGAGLLALLGLCFAARLRTRDVRDYYLGGVATAAATGAIGTWWAWMGEPLLPLIGASFLAILIGWFVGKLFTRLAPLLPWAAR